MHHARNAHAVVTDGTSIWARAGTGAGGPVLDVERFDGRSGTWRRSCRARASTRPRPCCAARAPWGPRGGGAQRPFSAPLHQPSPSTRPLSRLSAEDRLYFTIRDPVSHTVRLLKLRVGDSHHHRPVFLAELLTLPADDPTRIDTFTLFPVISGGKLFFAFRSVAGIFPLQTSLWVTNGTRRGTRMLSSALPSPDEQPTSTHAPVGDGRVVFVAFDQEHGSEPWVSDGTPNGTRLLQDIKPGPDSSFPSRFTRSDGFLLLRHLHAFCGRRAVGAPASARRLRPGRALS
ncbi:ELWxxDGT repeat protein [Cystobacter fuscus]